MSEFLSPIIDAIVKGDEVAVLHLLSLGGSVNAADAQTGLTPLHWTSASKEAEYLVPVLLARGTITLDGIVCHRLSCCWAFRRPRWAIVLETARPSAFYVYFSTYCAYCPVGALIDVKDNKGRTPLHLHSARGRSFGVTCLLHQGADVNLQTTDTLSTALHLAELETWVCPI
jgi:Ankyrin repeat